MMHCPAVIAVESVFEQIEVILVFGQHKHRLDLIESGTGCFPEISGNTSGIVTTVPIYVGFLHPVFHGINHLRA